MKEFERKKDEELVTLSQNGNRQAMDELVCRYANLVRGRARGYFLVDGETDDLIQEGMIGLFKAIRDFKEDKESSFFHFAELCITRQLCSALEASNRKKHLPLNGYISLSESVREEQTQLEDSLPFINQNPEQKMIEKELWEDFRERLSGNLSKMEKSVLSLYLDGYNYIQIAEITNKSPKSIDNALQRIRQKIKKMQD